MIASSKGLMPTTLPGGGSARSGRGRERPPVALTGVQALGARRGTVYALPLRMNDATLYGGCLCGAVRYRVVGPLGLVEHCHCSMCRKAHGAAFSTNAVVPTSALELLTGTEVIAEYESSRERRKCFCARCGSQLFVRRLDDPAVTAITLGTLEGEPGVRPERHVFVGSKASWDAIADALPTFTVYPGFEPDEGSGSGGQPARRERSRRRR